jgi:hypothetical protein
MQARHSVISLAALTRCMRRSSVVNNQARRFLAVAKMLVLIRRLWAGLVFDELPGGNHCRRVPAQLPRRIWREQVRN